MTQVILKVILLLPNLSVLYLVISVVVVAGVLVVVCSGSGCEVIVLDSFVIGTS